MNKIKTDRGYVLARLPVLLAPILLAACGGGGGGGGGSAPPPDGNTAPVAMQSCDMTVQAKKLTNGMLFGTDADGDPLTYEIIDQPDNGRVEITSVQDDIAMFTYTHCNHSDGSCDPTRAPYPRGRDSFTFRVSDGETRSNTATQTVIVGPNIMPLGDSITTGVTMDDPNNSSGDGNLPPPQERGGFRLPLYNLLANGGYPFDFVGSQNHGSGLDTPDSPFDPDDEAHGGFRAYEIADGADPILAHSGNGYTGVRNALNGNPSDIVLLHIGTNDFCCNRTPGAQTIADDVDRILTNIQTWEDSPGGNPVTVILSRIIDTLDDSDAGQIEIFNGLIGGMAADRIIVVDHEKALWDATNSPDPDLYASPLHPDQEGEERGYDIMADVWFGGLTGRTNSPEILTTCADVMN